MILIMVGLAATLGAQPLRANAPGTVDHLSRGRALGAENKWNEAEAELRIYRNQHPDSVLGVVLHAEALTKISQPFDAALEIQSFLKAHPEALRAHELYAVLAAGPLKDSSLAASELETCVRLAPMDFQAWESLGDVQIDKAKPDLAIEAYSHAFRLRPHNAVVAASLAHAYAEQGSLEKASVQFQAAIGMIRNSAVSDEAAGVVNYLYGVFLAEQGRGQESVETLTKALKFNPNSADAFYWRARAYEELKNSELAESDALKAIQLSPSSKEAPLFLIAHYRRAGDMKNAQKYADLAKQIADREQEQASFGRSLRDTLDKAEPLLKQGRFTEATPLYESIVKRLPTFYEAYFALGMCYAETGHFSDSETAFRKYLLFQPVSADGHAALGVLLLSQNRATDAIAELTQAIQIDPSAMEARKALASEYLKENNSRAAVEALRPAGKSNDEDLLLMLASALKREGDTKLALVEVNRALAVNPQNPDALQLKKSLESQITKNSKK